MAWYRAILQCEGVPPASGTDVAGCITSNFVKRNWHRNAECKWYGTQLTLLVENDFDKDGRAVMDEFSDELSACIQEGFDGKICILSIIEI